jgi:small-conductance mechanosensitive channel
MVATPVRSWIPAENISHVFQLEPVLVIFGFGLMSYVIYKSLLRNLQPFRHRILRKDFRDLLIHGVLTFVLGGLYWTGAGQETFSEALARTLPYLGLAGLVFMLVSLVEVVRILTYEYLLIFSRMKVGVPNMLRNVPALFLSIALVFWVATKVFEVNLASLLATSAVFSVVLGLALQDTLGNLFAGMAVQLDHKHYEIGDWLEIQNGSETWIGQVEEISWRATIMIGLFDERITVPNRLMGQSRINNHSTKERPVMRATSIALPHEVPNERAKTILLDVLTQVSMVRESPRPVIHVRAIDDSGVVYRLIYWINDFGEQYTVLDRVNAAVLKALREAGIPIARKRIVVEGPESVVQEPGAGLPVVTRVTGAGGE